METILLTAWGVTLDLIALYVIDAVCFGVTRATREVLGVDPDQAVIAAATKAATAVIGAVNHFWVWGICNPTWAWSALDTVEAALGKKPQGNQQYIKF